MSKKPQTVTGVATTGAVSRVELTWTPLPWEPLIDHYRVYALPTTGRHARPDEAHLVGKTVYPRFVHHGLDPAGEAFRYVIVAVSDAGRRGRPSSAVVGESQASVTATGRELARIGEFDGKSLELRFSPTEYGQIPKAYPTAVIDYVQGVDTPAEAWPYLLPGPGDAWAGRKAYRARWAVTLDAAPQRDVDLALWFVDTTRLGGRLDVAVNGRDVQSVELAKGATRRCLDPRWCARVTSSHCRPGP
ncbi:hypothetical protein [Micrococcus lylae]|uniref:hypothetical protein n=1 Tax=Micrococcus lylae TaxID=1273 RepID=UPI002155B750|nr:hypothetical protein [Micrococcus lylae]WIK81767.1 hypothetical protein CJ228_009165 [Micrococcus lylae]